MLPVIPDSLFRVSAPPDQQTWTLNVPLASRTPAIPPRAYVLENDPQPLPTVASFGLTVIGPTMGPGMAALLMPPPRSRDPRSPKTTISVRAIPELVIPGE